MLLNVDAHLPFKRSLVYAAYRDKLIDLVPYMPSVQQIKFISSKKEDGLLHLVYEWHGGAKIPKVARTFLSEDLLVWTEEQVWNESDFTTQWRIKTHFFTEAVYCVGKNRFLEDRSGTLIESRGELQIDPDQIKGTPRLLTAAISRIVEDSLAKQVTPNFLQMCEGVRQHLEKVTNPGLKSRGL
jgi:hypothetical protein